jgi:hypothetical protein
MISLTKYFCEAPSYIYFSYLEMTKHDAEDAGIWQANSVDPYHRWRAAGSPPVHRNSHRIHTADCNLVK